MKRVNKKCIWAAVLAVCLVISFAGCGSASGGEGAAAKPDSVAKGEDAPAAEAVLATAANRAEDAVPESTEAEEAVSGNESALAEANLDSLLAGLVSSQGLEFESNGDGTCTLIGIGACEGQDIVIPETNSSGETVTAVGEYAFYGHEAASITIPGLEIELDNDAFSGCSVGAVNIYGGTVTIGDNGFAYAENLSAVNMIGSTVEAGEYCFYNSGDDAALVIRNCVIEADDDAFSGSGFGSVAIHESQIETAGNAFAYSEDVISFSIADSTLDLGAYALYDTGDDAALTISNCIISGDDDVFSGNGFASVDISGSELTLGTNAFAYSEDVESMTITNSMLTLDEYALYNTGHHAQLTVSNSTIGAGDSMFSGNAFDSMSFENCNITAGDDAFAYAEDLVSVTISGGSIALGEYAFYSCNDDLIVNVNGGEHSVDSYGDLV